MILCLWSPLHPLSKLLAIQDHTQNLEEQLWMGGRREVSIIFYRPVTRSDLKQERSFFRGSVSSFLQLVVAEWSVSDYKKRKLTQSPLQDLLVAAFWSASRWRKQNFSPPLFFRFSCLAFFLLLGIYTVVGFSLEGKVSGKAFRILWLDYRKGWWVV